MATRKDSDKKDLPNIEKFIKKIPTKEVKVIKKVKPLNSPKAIKPAKPIIKVQTPATSLNLKSEHEIAMDFSEKLYSEIR